MSQNPPLEKPEGTTAIEVDGLEMAYGADGIAKINGKVAFIPGLLPEMKADVVLVQEKGSFSRGQIKSILEPGPNWQKPPCSIQDECGGCPWMTLKPSSAHREKRRLLSHFLRHLEVGKLSWRSETDQGYRHRMTFQLAPRKVKGLDLGFFAGKSHRLVKVDRCLVFSPGGNKLFQALQEEMSQAPPEVHAAGLELVMDITDETGLALWRLRKGKSSKELARFTRHLVKTIPNLVGAGWIRGRNPTWIGKEGVLYQGFDPRGKQCPGGGKLWASPGAFSQVNPIMNEVLVQTVLEQVGSLKEKQVLDMYCGMGNLTLPLAAKGAHVTAVEVVPQAISDGQKNARAWGLDKSIEWVVGDCTEFTSDKTWDLVVLDPPRAGAPEAMLFLTKLKPKAIIYISCSPPTLARDLKVLHEAGYSVESVVGLDMFPHTAHLETVVYLRR